MLFSNWLNRTFPENQIGNIRKFYILTALNNMWFLSGNWLFYWLRFMNYRQLGIVDASCFLFGLVMEIPTGAIADMIGKKKTITLGMFLAAIGFLFMGSGTNLYHLWIGFLIAQAGWAFYSGAAEALAYDSLVDVNKEMEYEKVISANGMIMIVTSTLAILLGGIMYVIYWRSTHLGMAIAYFAAFLISFGLVEPTTDSDTFSFTKWWMTLIDGVKEMALPKIKPFLIVMLTLMGSEYIFEWGFLKPAIAVSFGFLDQEQAIIFAGLGLLSAGMIRYVPKIRDKIDDKLGLYLLTILMGIGFVIAALPLKLLGLIPLFVISLAGTLVYPWISIVINKEIQAKHRATVLSTVSLITKIPYVIVAVKAGEMVQNGQLQVFNLGLGLMIICLMIINLFFGKMKVS